MFRATLKSLLSRKTRLVLSGLAVVLGVMFVSGSLVLTTTMNKSFTSLFATVYDGVDVQVAPKAIKGGEDTAELTGLPAGVVDTVRRVPGVAGAEGRVMADGARVVGHDGKVLGTFGQPRFGANWTGTSNLVTLRSGRGPVAADEIVVNGSLAKAGGFHLGEQVGVLTLEPKKTFTIVGIFGYSGDRDSLAGEQTVEFTTPVAQQLMLGRTGMYSAVRVTADKGVPATKLRDDVRAALGGAYDVQTGRQLADAQASRVQKGLSFFTYILLGFAGVALFVGVFLILNTFSIIVANRTRELALMRALGANRSQLIGSVLLEAFAVGLVASVLGLAAGIGVGAVLVNVLGSLSGNDLIAANLTVPASAVIAAFAVGIVVTIVAALLPAVRSSRTPPVEAMRDAVTADKPLTTGTLAGGGVTAVGAGLLGYGLFGHPGGNTTLWTVLGGVLCAFIGIALLTPVIARPVVSLLGRLFSWSVPGDLGRRNSARNPRRTAITAAALMIGIALITGISTVFTSATKSLNSLAATQVKADLIVSGDQHSEYPPTFDAAVLDQTRALPGVRETAGVYADPARVNGTRVGVVGVTDLRALTDLFSLKVTAGSVPDTGTRQLIVDATTAAKHGWRVGSPVTVQFTRGAPHTYTVAAVYAKSDTVSGIMAGTRDVAEFRVPQPSWEYVKTDAGATAAVRGQINRLLADSPEVTVTDRSGFVKQMTSSFDTILVMIQVLLALAILIAVLGIVNTLALSVIERTRELGLLRAIGLRRGQVMRMITVESVVISVFGALLGLAVGAGLGTAVVRALRDQGFTQIGYPWGQMALYLALAAVVGVVAAVLPAIRAARTNVLRAIAYE